MIEGAWDPAALTPGSLAESWDALSAMEGGAAAEVCLAWDGRAGGAEAPARCPAGPWLYTRPALAPDDVMAANRLTSSRN